MATEKAQTLNALRTKILADTVANAGSNRFGLFSYPPSGVWGSGDYAFEKAKKLGSDGKVLTQPRGIFANPVKKGKTESTFLSKSSYVTIGDKFLDPATIERQYQLAKKKKNPHEAEFKPSNGTKSDPFQALFEHKTDHVEVKKNFRGPDKRVVVPPKNILVNPPKHGHGDSTIGHLFTKKIEHLADPYERKRELEAKEREESKKKLQENPFKSTSHGGLNFANDKNTFGKDANVLPPAKSKSMSVTKQLHEAPFKPANPSKHGYNRTIGKFPEYKEDPIKHAERKIEDPSKKKDAFRPNDMAFCERPTPSVSLNKVNLKNEMARISAGYL